MVIRTGLQIADLLALEYVQLKEEQRLRIGTRDNLLYATLGCYAAVVAGVLQTGDVRVALLLPALCLILGWTYHVNDNRITAIGRYVESTIVPRLRSITRSRVPILAWERAHRTDRDRRARKVWQTSVDLLAYVVPIVAAVGTVAASTRMSLPVAALATAEAVAGVLLAAAILTQAVRGARMA